jgi:hypothetical protein
MDLLQAILHIRAQTLILLFCYVIGDVVLASF